MWHIHVHTAERMWLRPPPKVIQAIASQTPSHLGCPCVQGFKWCKQLWAVLYLPEFFLLYIHQCHRDYNGLGCILERTLYLEMLRGFLSAGLVIDWLASRSWCQGSCLGWSVWSTDLLTFPEVPRGVWNWSDCCRLTDLLKSSLLKEKKIWLWKKRVLRVISDYYCCISTLKFRSLSLLIRHLCLSLPLQEGTW